MPNVPERPLSYGELRDKLRRKSNYAGTRNYREVQHPRKNSKHGYIKTYKLKDKHLITDDIARINHIKSIKNEL